MLKDILTLMLAIILSFATGGSVQDEEPNDSVFQTETIYSFDGRLRVDIDATEMMVRLDITDEERGELLYFRLSAVWTSGESALKRIITICG